MREGRSWVECWEWVFAAIERNADMEHELAAKLDAVNEIKGKRLAAILRRVTPIPEATS